MLIVKLMLIVQQIKQKNHFKIILSHLWINDQHFIITRITSYIKKNKK